MNFKKILATAVSAVVLTTGMAIAAFADYQCRSECRFC